VFLLHIFRFPILQTLLGLANLDEAKIRKKLVKTHSEVQPLPGRDLSKVLKGTDKRDLPVYFMTEDEVSKGVSEQSYEPVIEPAKVEAVIGTFVAFPTDCGRTSEPIES